LIRNSVLYPERSKDAKTRGVITASIYLVNSDG
jgi:hypothetical protein